MSGKGGHPPPPPPSDELGELIDVVAVGESIRSGDVTLGLLSVERYEAGFLVTLRLLAERTNAWPRHELLHPWLTLEAHDEAGDTAILAGRRNR